MKDDYELLDSGDGRKLERFGKYPQMPEVSSSELEPDARRLDLPFLRQVGAAMPVVAVLAVEGCVSLRPVRGAFAGTPHRLRTRPRQDIFPEALELPPVSTVQELVIVFHVMRIIPYSATAGRKPSASITRSSSSTRSASYHQYGRSDSSPEAGASTPFGVPNLFQ